jgi:hypothetical protein
LIAHNNLSQFYLANGLDLISEIEARCGLGETKRTKQGNTAVGKVLSISDGANFRAEMHKVQSFRERPRPFTVQIQPSTSVEQFRGYITHLTAAHQAPHKCVQGQQTPSGGGAEG